ncbi:MAG TPA: HPr family phosphocarrier protein [Candidatus Methanoperedens sp.]|nr:HPr family phosphocarrier protein [Candidatus Methanoperedens sp.]
MISRELTIVNKLGLHARAASHLVKVASGFAAQITVGRGGATANAKSIMGLMLLAAAKGQTVTVAAEGPDECEALAAVEKLVRDRFNEEQ